MRVIDFSDHGDPCVVRQKGFNNPREWALDELEDHTDVLLVGNHGIQRPQVPPELLVVVEPPKGGARKDEVFGPSAAQLFQMGDRRRVVVWVVAQVTTVTVLRI